jgi:hypothetical protein
LVGNVGRGWGDVSGRRGPFAILFLFIGHLKR